MTVSISASMSMQMSAQKSVTTGDPTATAPSLALQLGTISAQWNGSSTPNGLDAWSGLVTLSSGAATIDLTSLTQLGLSTTVNATGYKVRAIYVIPTATNANPIQVGTGASNGYASLGVLSALNAGDAVLRTSVAAVAIDSTHKTLDFAGTGAQSAEVLIVFGS